MKVCMVVPNSLVKGGIASVVNGYRGSELEKINNIIYVESYCDGNRLIKFFKAVGGYFDFIKKVILTKDKPQLIHIHSSFGPSFYRKIPFVLMSNMVGIPVINHIHGAEFEYFYTNASESKKRLIKKIYNKCQSFVVLSEEWKEKISDIVPEDRINIVENYCIIPDSVNCEERNYKQILFLGELGERKGCFDIPEIWKRVKGKHEDARLIMAGDGQKEELINIFKTIDSSASFPGWVRGNEKEKLLRKSAIFLFPSYNEGMPMAVLEAMSYEMGIVTTPVGGIPQLIEGGVSGYLCAPGNIETMADAIIKLLDNKQEVINLGISARKVVEASYSLKSHINKVNKVYNKTWEQFHVC